MGWKSLKDAHRIHHIVTADGEALHIGHKNNLRLASIDQATGDIQGDGSREFLRANYPHLADATSGERKRLIDRPDTFQRSLPVYSVKNGSVVQSACENIGYPNVTHDGVLMYSGVFTDDYHEAVGWAKFELIYDRNRHQRECDAHRDALARGNLRDDSASQERTNQLEANLRAVETQLMDLNRRYPLVEPIDPFDRDDLVVSMAPSM